MSQVQRDLLFIAGVHTVEAYSALIITGSGTAANEAVLTSGVPPDALVIVLSNGEFGERLAELSRIYNPTEVISSEWGEDLDLVQLERLLANTPQALIAMVHHETSTGLLNPIGQVGSLCKRYGAKLFVDAVSSFAADPISLENSGITFLSTSSGKAIASYPGLSFVLGKNKDFAKLGDYPVKNHYLNLYRYFQASTKDRQTPNTPAVSLIATLHESLQEICSEGLSQRYRRLCDLASYMRAALAARDLYKPVAKTQSVILTNAFMPDKMTFADLQLRLKEKGFVIYDAKGPLRGRFFQVSIIGDITIADIDRFFVAFDSI
jgi:2-aminoethylphosphonate-pyruvate transaminase